MTPLDPYVAVLTCRGCGSLRYVHKWAERFRYWWCHTADDGRQCQTFNVWK